MLRACSAVLAVVDRCRPRAGLWLGAVLVAALAPACAGPAPTVEGPDDFVEVVESALESARKRLPDQRSCLVGFVVVPAWELDDRAAYEDGVISIRVPATAPRIRQLVIHELAHHLDATCPGVDDVRPRFQSAQGSNSPWAEGPTWAETPGEQFAEALTVVVLGRQRANNVTLRSEAVDVVASWAGAPP